jgi:drug/metabolite transporter (DMT)-like permease
VNALAIGFALAAALFFGLGNALEHRIAAETEDDGTLGVGLLGRLARSKLWLLGMAGDVGAYGFQAAALAFGSLLVVQPLLVCGLLVALPVNARWTGRHIERRAWIAAIVLCISLSVFLLEAAPSGGVSSAPVHDWMRVGGTVLAFVIGAVLVARVTRGHVRAALLGFAAGGLFGITAALTKTFVDQISHGVPYTAEHWEVYALAILSIIGILFVQHGFQASSLSASLPALEATEPLIAASVGIALLHEQLNGRTTFDNVAIALSIVAALACVITLANLAGRDAHDEAKEDAPETTDAGDIWHVTA